MYKDLFICRSVTHRRQFVIKRPELERIAKSYEPASNSLSRSGKKFNCHAQNEEE
jgi:hypothetical protein